MQYIKVLIVSMIGLFCWIPQSALANTPALMPQQESGLAQNIPTITVRKGEHLNYSRVVFDFTNSVVYQANLTDDKLRLVFDVLFIPEFGKLMPEPLKWIANPQVVEADTLMAVEFDVEANSELVHFYLGNKVVIDVYDPTAAKGLVEEDNLARIRQGATIKETEEADTDPEPEVTDYTVTPVYEELDNGIMLTYSTKIATATAVFERGGILWVVLETTVPIDHSNFDGINPFMKERIRSLEVDKYEGATIMRYAIKPDQSIGVERHGMDWKISLKDTATAPKNPLTPIKQMTSDEDFRIFVPAADVGTRLELIDPIVGDNLTIVPLRSSSRGLPVRRDYADFILPVTAQGLVVQRISDQLSVYRYRNGIAIGAGDPSLSSMPGGASESGDQGQSLLVDFQGWSMGSPQNFRTIESELLNRMSMSNTDRRNAARWALARFYLAHNRAADAEGILDQMLDDDSQLASQPQFRAARGIAHSKLGHYVQALHDFEMRELNTDQDVALWRATIYQVTGRNEEAVSDFEQGRDAIGRYNALERGDFILSSARAYFDIDRIEKAEYELDQLAGHRLTLNQMREEVLLRAEIALSRGQGEIAMAALNDLARSRDRSIASRARYTRLEYQMEAGAITRDDAVAEMERLRYAWRGGEFEMNLLRALGDIYIEDNNYKEGLDVMRQIVSYFSKTDLAKKTSNDMTTIFRDLYLNCQADTMHPFEALDLYDDFKELTPYGSEGDRLIRRIADRLVGVELFADAIELLDYQIRDRIKAGASRAQIAANLAKIYLLDGRPEDAIQILRATRVPNMPLDIEYNRNLIEARALYEEERFEEAEVLIAPIESLDADIILADIYWQAGDWDRLIMMNNKILGDGWRTKEKLDVNQRLLLVRLAIAYTNNQDKADLAIMRGRYLEQIIEGDFAASFDLLTNPDDLSSRDIATIISEVDDVENVQSYLQKYRSDFINSDCEPLFDENYDEEQKILGQES